MTYAGQYPSRLALHSWITEFLALFLILATEIIGRLLELAAYYKYAGGFTCVPGTAYAGSLAGSSPIY